MKIMVIHLALLLVLCIILPFMFNIKYHENIANYPASTSIELTDASASPDPSSIPVPIQGMTNQYKRLYDEEETSDDFSIEGFFNFIYKLTREGMDDRILKDIDTNHSSEQSEYDNKEYTLKHKEKLVNNDGILNIQKIEETSYIPQFEKIKSELDTVQRDYMALRAKHPLPASNTTSTSTSVGAKQYTSYDRYIDRDLLSRNTNASVYLSTKTPKSTDTFIRNLESDKTLIDFFKNLYSQNKEALTNHTLEDKGDNTTYTLNPGKKLVYNNGELTTKIIDDTSYNNILYDLQDNLIKVRNAYNQELSKYPDMMNTLGIDAANSEPSTTTATTSGTAPASSTSGSSYAPSGSSSARSKCTANYGTEIDEPVCCGQEGKLTSTKFACPADYPTCTGYKCGSNFGTCGV